MSNLLDKALLDKFTSQLDLQKIFKELQPEIEQIVKDEVLRYFKDDFYLDMDLDTIRDIVQKDLEKRMKGFYK